MYHCCVDLVFIFFNDTATTEIYTLSLHDALPICEAKRQLRAEADYGQEARHLKRFAGLLDGDGRFRVPEVHDRSEEHTSELQSRQYLVCRLLLEKKKTQYHFSSPTSTYYTTELPD